MRQQQLDFETTDAAEPPPARPTLPAPPHEDTESDTSARIARAVDAGLLGESFGSSLRSIFDSMEFAEDEIAQAKLEHPERADLLQDSFRYLAPSDVLQGAPERLYRAHARELLTRVATDAKLEPGTDAELIAAIQELTLRAPPTRETTLLYMELFERLFPDDAAHIFEETGDISPDRYERTRMDELEGELRRKLSRNRDCHG